MGGVDGQAERFVASGFGALHQGAGDLAVFIGVELEPERAAGGGSDLFQRGSSQGADGHQRFRCARAAHRGKLAFGMAQAVHGRGRNEDGRGHRLAQHGGAGVDDADIDEHARAQADALEGGAVFAQGHFVFGPARVVVEDHAWQMLLRQRFQFQQVHPFCHCLLPKMMSVR